MPIPIVFVGHLVRSEKAGTAVTNESYGFGYSDMVYSVDLFAVVSLLLTQLVFSS